MSNGSGAEVLHQKRLHDPCYAFINGRQLLTPQWIAEKNVAMYCNMGVVGVYTGPHLREGDIRKPVSSIAIPNRDLVAIIHNGRLISLFSATTCSIVQTFVVRDPVGYPPTRGLRGEVVADDVGYLYVTSEGAVSILRFSIDNYSDPSHIQPEVFATVPDKNRFFRGMAISNSLKLLFTAYGKEILGFALQNGAVIKRLDLNDELQSCLVQSCFDMPLSSDPLSKLFLVVTSLGGTKLHGTIVDDCIGGTNFVSIGSNYHGGIGQIRHCTFDAIGNLMCVDSKLRLVHIFAPRKDAEIISFAPPEEDDNTGEWVADLKDDTAIKRLYNPSSVAVVLDPFSKRPQPMVITTDFSMDSILMFAPIP